MLVKKLFLDNLLCVDKLHYREVKILNELHDTILEKNIEQIDVNLDRLVEDVQLHFEGEEKKMFEYNYPEANMHQFVHGSALTRLLDAQWVWQKNKDVEVLKNYVEKVFTPWLNAHIRTMDMKACDYIVGQNWK